MTLATLILKVISALSLVLAIPVAVFVALLSVRLSKPPSGLPWVGLQDKRWFPKLRAALREVTVGGRIPIEQGYHVVCDASSFHA